MGYKFFQSWWVQINGTANGRETANGFRSIQPVEVYLREDTHRCTTQKEAMPLETKLKDAFKAMEGSDNDKIYKANEKANAAKELEDYLESPHIHGDLPHYSGDILLRYLETYQKIPFSAKDIRQRMGIPGSNTSMAFK